CSTPEGIGAGITRWHWNRRTTAQRAQRPKASERGSLALADPAVVEFGVLNARRHRSGDHGGGSRDRPPLPLVLNARRHRSGDHGGIPGVPANLVKSATPEALGAEITRATGAASPPSTRPQRPTASCSSPPIRCSTPEGIGAGI